MLTRLEDVIIVIIYCFSFFHPISVVLFFCFQLTDSLICFFKFYQQFYGLFETEKYFILWTYFFFLRVNIVLTILGDNDFARHKSYYLSYSWERNDGFIPFPWVSLPGCFNFNIMPMISFYKQSKPEMKTKPPEKFEFVSLLFWKPECQSFGII